MLLIPNTTADHAIIYTNIHLSDFTSLMYAKFSALSYNLFTYIHVTADSSNYNLFFKHMSAKHITPHARDKLLLAGFLTFLLVDRNSGVKTFIRSSIKNPLYKSLYFVLHTLKTNLKI